MYLSLKKLKFDTPITTYYPRTTVFLTTYLEENCLRKYFCAMLSHFKPIICFPMVFFIWITIYLSIFLVCFK
uniref:Uncharacterized protein n=1 Tax=Manihot esculenta TaxID=3983 RepID=A0A2C9VGS4_MANES